MLICAFCLCIVTCIIGLLTSAHSKTCHWIPMSMLYFGNSCHCFPLSYRLISLRASESIGQPSMMNGRRRRHIKTTNNPFRVRVNNSSNISHYSYARKILLSFCSVYLQFFACARRLLLYTLYTLTFTVYCTLWLLMYSVHADFHCIPTIRTDFYCTLNQEIIDSTRTEIFAKEPKLVKLFRELNSIVVRCQKKFHWLFFLFL